MKNIIIEEYAANLKATMSKKDVSMHIKHVLQTQSEISLNTLPLQDPISVSIHTVSANYDKESQLHSHDFFEIIYVYKGSAVQHSKNSKVTLEEGCVCLMNTNYKHGLSIDNDDSIVFNILISKPVLSDSFCNFISEGSVFADFFVNALFSNSKKGEYLIFEKNNNSNLDALLQSLLEEYISKKPDYRIAIQSYLSLVFTELHRKHFYTSDISSDQDIDFSAILSYAFNHLNNISVNALAEHFHYNPAYLSKALKNYLGRNFSSVISEIRLKKAASYLKTTSMRIDTIVELLGYYDRSYFNRIFKKRYGVSPNEYRDLHRNQ
ncbi:MAG: AraC family transcriptional regulator [Parasporobacterium sp.]|nr:AraC family transcriptional regulator [Parasporobacterium sp.]